MSKNTDRGHLRNWASPSYSKLDGRAASSIFDNRGSQQYTNATEIDNQIPGGFHGRDRRATQGGPVKNRPTTQTVVDK